jgi:ABC-type transport system involved in multi-copper enzyme maturation permease subunit
MSHWASWRRQALVIAASEVRRRLLSRGALALLVLAGAPVVLCGVRFALAMFTNIGPPDHAAEVAYAILYRSVLLRLTVFFGCMIVFTPMIRGDILDRSLHYWFLAPVRRSVLAAGKFTAGLAVTLPVFGATTLLTWLLVTASHGWVELSRKLASPAGLGEAAAYLAATWLACLGYGGVFLAVGIVFKQPIVPALGILGWESLLFLMPAALKKISVVHYVESLLPIAPPEGPLAIIAQPASPWIAVPGVVLVAAAALLFAARRLKRTEILYGVE